MVDPQVSVVIPTYNRRAMVVEATASVLAQRDVSLELIVVDDGSTDGTFEELRARFDQPTPIRLIRHPLRRGPAAARNTGAAAAQGSLIAFLDSDDLWSPLKLRRQLDFMAAHPRCAIAQCAERWLRDGRQVNPGRRHLKRAGDIFVESLRTCLISPSAVILRAELFRAIGGFDEQFEAAEDYDLWLRILARHEVGIVAEPLVTRRAGHPDQLSATVCALDRFRILALLKLLAGDGLSEERRTAVCEVLAEKCRIYGHGLKRRGRSEAVGFVLEIGQRATAGLICGGADFTREIAIMYRLVAAPETTITSDARPSAG